MHYTLSALLQEGSISEIRLLTREQNFDEIPIESVSVQELPVEGFIRKNELVLSTAMGCREDVASFIKLVQEVGKAHAAALFLSLQDRIYEVPQIVIDHAEQLGLPVFSISWEQRFSEIQMMVARSISNKKLFAYLNLQTELFNAFFDSASLEDAAHLIDQSFHTLVTVKDSAQRVLAVSRPDSDEPNVEALDEIEILLNGRPVGSLHLSKSSVLGGFGQEAGEAEKLIEKYLCFPLSLWFNRKNIEDLVSAQLKNDFVWNLANKNYDSLADMAQQGLRLHFDLNRPYTCIALRAVARQGEKQDAEEYTARSAIASAKIEAALIQGGHDFHLGIMVAARSLDFIIFLENRGAHFSDSIERYVDEIEQKLLKNHFGYIFYWGISESTMKQPVFHQLYQNASMALQYCLTGSEQQYRFTYRDTKQAQVISVLASNPQVQKIARETIGPLQEYDATSGINLLGTVMVFLKCNYNISLTARTLHIHRQSLLYRLEKIEALTGMSLNNHQDLFLLEICTHIYYHY